MDQAGVASQRKSTQNVHIGPSRYSYQTMCVSHGPTLGAFTLSSHIPLHDVSHLQRICLRVILRRRMANKNKYFNAQIREKIIRSSNN